MKRKRNTNIHILAGDVGGTKTFLGLFKISPESCDPIAIQTFPSKSYDGVETIIQEFLKNKGTVSAICLGVAGPIVNRSVSITNLPWKITERSLERYFSIPVVLVNDLVANAYGIASLKPKDFVVLSRGKNTVGNAALLSAGTGLGAAILFWDGVRHVPSSSEGGHVDFGPKNRVELCLLTYLFERYGHVSYERLLSGSGLVTIYQYLKDSGEQGTEQEWVREQMQKEDPAVVITESARLGKDALCAAALDMFCSIYGSAAGNLALQGMATGGMYLGGGIAPKIIWKLKEGTFLKAFMEKGRLSDIVRRIPVKVIMNERAALYGAAARAQRMIEERR
ncbi:MAG: glucokinase [Nitrospirota bacterium]